MYRLLRLIRTKEKDDKDLYDNGKRKLKLGKYSPSVHVCIQASCLLTILVVILIIITLLLRFGWAKLEEKLEDDARERAELELQAKLAKQVRIYVSGEPTFDEDTSDTSVVDATRFDLFLLSGGANLSPKNSFYFAELLRPFTNIFKKNRELYYDMSERTYADVMFRSSVCDKTREDLVGIIRRKVESAGFTFKQEGKCGGTGYAQRVNHAWNREIDRWAFCDTCKRSKIVLAVERHTSKHVYLGEKLFLPMEYGAVTAYSGNGHQWMDLLGVNRDAFLERNQFASDEEFADAIVDLLKDTERLSKMQHQDVFHDEQIAKNMVEMYVDPHRLGAGGYPALYHYIQSNPKLRNLVGRKLITYHTSSGDPYNTHTIIKALFGAKYAVRFERIDGPDADVEIYRCC